jgi:IBR domain, a half RING-finger domain
MSDTTDGIYCTARSHFLCRECFPKYIDSVCDEPARLQRNDYLFRCPDPTCASAPWDSQDISAALSNNPVLSRYIDTIIQRARVRKVGFGGEDVDDPTAVQNALSLLCPNLGCRAALDQNPDGCSAMQCVSCGYHFCWLCHRLDPVQTKESNHQHVLECVRQYEGIPNFFAKPETIRIATNKLRVRAIRAVLIARASVDEPWDSERFRGAVKAVQSNLDEIGLSYEDVFKDSELVNINAPNNPDGVGAIEAIAGANAAAAVHPDVILVGTSKVMVYVLLSVFQPSASLQLPFIDVLSAPYMYGLVAMVFYMRLVLVECVVIQRGGVYAVQESRRAKFSNVDYSFFLFDVLWIVISTPKDALLTMVFGYSFFSVLVAVLKLDLPPQSPLIAEGHVVYRGIVHIVRSFVNFKFLALCVWVVWSFLCGIYNGMTSWVTLFVPLAWMSNSDAQLVCFAFWDLAISSAAQRMQVVAVVPPAAP